MRTGSANAWDNMVSYQSEYMIIDAQHQTLCRSLLLGLLLNTSIGGTLQPKRVGTTQRTLLSPGHASQTGAWFLGLKQRN